MSRVRRVAYAGAIVMIGLVGCSAAEGSTPTPSASGTPSASISAVTPSPSVSRQNILVQLNPDKVTAGESSKVFVLANCPVPTGGPAHTGTATSKAFLSGVPLNPVTTTASPAVSVPTPTGTATPGPWVRGEGEVSGTVKRGTYTVAVKCEGTNDTGKATLRVVAADANPTGVPTKAPHAGGGGTFGKDVDDSSGLPLGPAGIVVALLLIGGAVFMLRRSRA
ncbi:hypothetical protein [Nonomuraea sediminis]|uniref:hypothetical protein n=1 Tax=Nonomuraea sediminis TaxID=2835864 RepID=UPI001BDCC85A|nr:hypothetical protein [Nonomuraea sediminis]